MGLIIAISSLSSSLIISTKLFLFEIVPSIYFQILTPLHLFLLLNLLIISILAITHLCKEAAPRQHRSASSSSGHPIMHRLRDNYAGNQARFFAGIMLSDHDHTAADHFDNMVHAAQLPDHKKQPAAAQNSTAFRSDQLRRRAGDGVVSGAASTAEIEQSADVSAEDLMAKPANYAYDVVLNDRCRHGRAGIDPDLHHNHAVINESGQSESTDDAGNLQDNQAAAVIKEVISEINMRSCGADMQDNHADDTHNDLHISSLDSESTTQEQERPLASTRFTSKKTTTKTHLDMLRSNSPLRISRPSAKRGDTIDATWKAICESKLRHSSPLSRHHKTSYTKKVDHHTLANKIGDSNESKGLLQSPLSPSKQRHHMFTSSSSALMRKREPSIPRDELNARVESFISRFNEQIRIQRQESLLNSKNVVSKGAY